MSTPKSEQSIFLQAIELGSAGERSAYLDEACRGNAALRAQLEALLATDAMADRSQRQIAPKISACPPRVPPGLLRKYPSRIQGVSLET